MDIIKLEKVKGTKKIYYVIPMLINVDRCLLMLADVNKYQQMYVDISRC